MLAVICASPAQPDSPHFANVAGSEQAAREQPEIAIKVHKIKRWAFMIASTNGELKFTSTLATPAERK
jgi:hypothetical protein